ncbi:hypothetical protein INT46_005223 [Mucor plumbeus]|uniref:Uncharacterized protein n=1 Tax=Mucor plumbeus TaxID=97098 RepID=A0A8H7UXZ3_9FUNG|nr:hypothetical protein INT46_005223 [Mucor plumbeus]
MRPTSLYSIQADPYRNRRSSTKENSPTTPKSTTQLIFQPEIGRQNSYLPYSNHAPDFVQSRAELYVEEDDTVTIASSSHPVDMINGEHVNNTLHLHHSQSTSVHISLTDTFIYKKKKDTHRIWIFVFGLLGILGVLGIIIYLCWPRLPQLAFKSEKAERIGEPADWGPNQQPWLRAAWKLNLTLDNQANFVPTRVKNIELILMDRDTNQPFAWSRTGPINLAPHKESLATLIFRVDYESQSVNDTTFKNLYNACGPQMPTEPPALNAIIHITGIAWSSIVTVHPPELGGFYCPFN